MSLFVQKVTDEWGTSYALTGLGYGALVALMIVLLPGFVQYLCASDYTSQYMEQYLYNYCSQESHYMF